MKRSNCIWGLLIVFFGFIVGSIATEKVLASEGYRFTHIYEQSVENQHMKDTTFLVYHDNSTGDEIICAQQGNTSNISCFKSGRNWK